MGEQEEQKEKEYIAKLVSALDEVESSLSEIGAMELRRRLTTVSAIIHSVRPMFHEVLSKQKGLKARRESRVPWLSLLAALVVGGVLHYLFRDTSRSFEFTFGMFIVAYGVVGWVIYVFETEKMARSLKDSQRALDEMLYRWIANGGDDRRFWQLSDQVDGDTGDIDMDYYRYRRWWYEMKGDLVDSIRGETRGLGRWRPSSW